MLKALVPNREDVVSFPGGQDAFRAGWLNSVPPNCVQQQKKQYHVSLVETSSPTCFHIVWIEKVERLVRGIPPAKLKSRPEEDVVFTRSESRRIACRSAKNVG